MSEFSKEELRVAKTARMHAIYLREKKLRENADLVIAPGEPKPRRQATQDPVTKRWTYYVESSTAAALRRIFEDGEQPYW